MMRSVLLILVIISYSTSCQTKPKLIWEKLECDTTKNSENLPLTTRSIVQELYKNTSTVNTQFNELVYVVWKSEKEAMWHKISHSKAEKTNLDSLSLQYLRLLLPQSTVMYDRWKSWITPFRKDFLARRDSVMVAFEKQNPKFKIKLISDLRNRAVQQRFLKNGQSSANLSFHEIGLAGDFAIYRGKTYQRSFNVYKPLDSLTTKYGLRWGGNFVGFLDAPHIQYYYNSADLVLRLPFLSLEFDYYFDRYLKKIKEHIAQNKEYLVEDSKEILGVLNNLKKKEACICLSAYQEPKKILLFPAIYEPKKDIFIFSDIEKKTVWIKYPNQILRKYKVGTWK